MQDVGPPLYVEWMSGRVTELVAALLVSAAIVGCGGGGGGQATSSSSSTTASTATQIGGSATVTTGPVHASLRGENHAPKQGSKWSYDVRVTDTAGRPLSGSVEIEFVYGDQVVGHDTPRTHPVSHGRWHDDLTFPPAAVGQALTVRAVVHTAGGSTTLNWPIKVTP
jgi:hypothetical protein